MEIYVDCFELQKKFDTLLRIKLKQHLPFCEVKFLLSGIMEIMKSYLVLRESYQLPGKVKS